MNRLLSLLTICGFAVLVSCQPEDTKTIEKDFSFEASATTVNAGETVTFTDLSINVESRTWTFPDGTPETSAEPVADVVFSSAGIKEVTLVVTYSDGTEDRGSIDIEVLDPLGAEISVSGLTEKGCAKKGAQITFSLADVVGEPDSYEWTFPGGNPATSTEASPVVTWNSQMNDVEVTCVLKRNADGASTTVTRHIIAGDYPMLVYDDEYNVDVFGFEKGNTNLAWYNYGNFPNSSVEADKVLSEHPDLMTIVDGGANGSAKCMKIDLTKGQLVQAGEYLMPDCTWILAHRKNWSNNPWLTVGQKYRVSVYLKTDADIASGTSAAALNWFGVNAWVSTEIDPMRNLNPATEWSKVFDGDEFVETSDQTVDREDVWLKDPANMKYLSNEWEEYSFEFTVQPGELGNEGDFVKNSYVIMGLVSVGASIYVDDAQIYLIEE